MPKTWNQFIKLTRNNYEFNLWNRLKQKLDALRQEPQIKEGQIWWCSIGKNVGVEINGKNASFSRPVLVFKKLNKHSFVALALTSQPHFGPWYVKFKFKGRVEYLNLAQIKTTSAARLTDCMGEVSDGIMDEVNRRFIEFYGWKKRKK